MKLEQSDKAIIFANTQIPDIFLAEYLTSMTGDYLKIYLYLIFLSKYNSDISVNDLSKMIMENRTKGFSPLIKRRFVIGSYVLQKENQEKLFLNACRVRRMIVDRVNELFLDYDGLILPSAGSVAPKLSDCNQNLSSSYLLLDNHLEIGNFGGMPSITIPCGFVNGMPIGVNITGRVLEDDLVLNMAYKLESVMPYANMIVGEDDV